MVTFKGMPLTLIGPKLHVGEKAPSAKVTDQAMQLVTFQPEAKKITLLSTVPSLDTPVCDLETKRFNDEAKKLKNTTFVTVSRDLPFAQKRWCGASHVDQLAIYSDYRDGSFGQAWGVLIQELALLARAVFIINSQGVIEYIEIVPEIAEQPNFEKILTILQKVQ